MKKKVNFKKCLLDGGASRALIEKIIMYGKALIQEGGAFQEGRLFKEILYDSSLNMTFIVILSVIVNGIPATIILRRYGKKQRQETGEYKRIL